MTEKYHIPTFSLPLSIGLSLTVPQTQDITITGSDKVGNIIYFRRKMTNVEKGVYELEFPMPISPDKLVLSIKSLSTVAQKPIVEKLSSAPFLFSDIEDKEYYDFIFDFAKKEKTLPLGKYTSPSGKFTIVLSDHILDDNGKKSLSPAVTYMGNGTIELAKSKLKDLTVFMIVFILLHERMHYKLQSFDEETCDRYAVTEFRNAGFPSNECVNAFVDVFDMMKNKDGSVDKKHEQSLIDRTNQMWDFLSKNTPLMKRKSLIK